MSPRRQDGIAEGGGGRAATTMLLVLAVAIGMLMLVRARPAPESFDPRSSRADGARALVLLLEQQGATVAVGHDVPSPGDDTRLLVLSDRLGDRQRKEFIDFVEAGGVAIVADPASTLYGGPGLDGSLAMSVEATPGGLGGVLPAELEANVEIGACTIDALTHLRGVFVPEGVLLAVAPDEPACFATESTSSAPRHAFVVRRAVGSGSVIGLGDNHVFTNEFIRYADNSGLGVALLAPGPNRVAVVIGDEAPRTADDLGSGEQTLRDLVRPGVWMALAQLALAFVVLALARGVRVGRAVVEHLPAPIAGSELVGARGIVMHRAGHATRAGQTLRADLHRELCERFGLPRSAGFDAVVGEATRRSVVDAAMLREVLAREVFDAAQLLALSQDIAAAREALDQIPDLDPDHQGVVP